MSSSPRSKTISKKSDVMQSVQRLISLAIPKIEIMISRKNMVKAETIEAKEANQSGE